MKIKEERKILYRMCISTVSSRRSRVIFLFSIHTQLFSKFFSRFVVVVVVVGGVSKQEILFNSMLFVIPLIIIPFELSWKRCLTEKMCPGVGS